jgi:exopolyphosphatase/guanosine-5'-triphosphate,3'-diphosphate pyrophosphatase
MSQNKAIIDIGSNNVLLLIAQLQQKGELTLHRASRISELAKDMKDGMLAEAGIDRTLSIIRSYIAIARRFDSEIFLIATSAARDAVNINKLSMPLLNEYGLQLHIISGEEEAKFNGLANLNEFDAESLLVFDIGGGSTEFSLIQNQEITGKQSIDLGIRRLDNLFGNNAWQERVYIKKCLNEISIKPSKETMLVGVGGTVTSLAAMLLGLKKYDEKLVHGYKISCDDIENTLEKVKSLSAEQVPQLLPFNPISRSLLLTGIIIVREVIALFNAPVFFVSDRTWQYGILAEIRHGRWNNARN